MFRVLENGKLARYPECNVHKSWNNCDFPSIVEAALYAEKWLGSTYSPGVDFLVKLFMDGESFDYDGYGDTISVQEITP